MAKSTIMRIFRIPAEAWETGFYSELKPERINRCLCRGSYRHVAPIGDWNENGCRETRFKSQEVWKPGTSVLICLHYLKLPCLKSTMDVPFGISPDCKPGVAEVLLLTARSSRLTT